MASTAAQAGASPTKKPSKPSPNFDKLQKIRDITASLLNGHFGMLMNAPDILYVSMAIWGMESGWNLWHNKGGVKDSRHFSPVDPNRSTLIGKGYYNSDPILSFRSRIDYSAQEAKNIAEGFVAHGLSACMGCYHVRGTPNFKSDFKPYSDLVEGYGLAVNPGESITNIFPDNDLGMQRSILAGLIILENKFKIGMRVHKNNPAKAIEAAVGYYVGKAGARDVNGYSPEMRQRDVMYSPSDKLSALAQIGVVRTGQAGISVSDYSQVQLAKITPPPNTVQNDQTRSGVSDNSPQKPIGCTSVA